MNFEDLTAEEIAAAEKKHWETMVDWFNTVSEHDNAASCAEAHTALFEREVGIDHARRAAREWINSFSPELTYIGLHFDEAKAAVEIHMICDCTRIGLFYNRHGRLPLVCIYTPFAEGKFQANWKVGFADGEWLILIGDDGRRYRYDEQRRNMVVSSHLN